MRQTRYVFVFGLFTVFVLFLMILSMVTESVKIPFGNIVGILAGKRTDAAAESILWQIRLPRAFAAVVLGGALAALCKQVICCCSSFAEWEPENKELYEALMHRKAERTACEA